MAFMKSNVSLPFLITLGLVLFAWGESEVGPLPDPVSNNAVAALKLHGELTVFTFMGIGAKKTWDSVTTDGYSINASSGKVEAIHPVPGTAGRIAAMATGAAGR